MKFIKVKHWAWTHYSTGPQSIFTESQATEQQSDLESGRVRPVAEAATMMPAL